MVAIFGLVAALSIGLSDIFGRRMVNAASPVVAATTMQLFALIGTIVIAGANGGSIERGPMMFGAASGVGMAAGLGCYYTGIQRSSATVVAPIVAVLNTILPFAWELSRGATLTALAVVGSVLAVLGLFLITSGEVNPDDLKSGLSWGLLSGFGYGSAGIFFIEAASSDSLWPSASQRFGSLLCLGAAGLLIQRRQFRLPRTQIGNGIAAGLLTAVTSLSMLIGLAIDPIVTTIAVSSFPAFAVIVGRVVFGDSITQRQALGIAVGVVGIALVSTN